MLAPKLPREVISRYACVVGRNKQKQDGSAQSVKLYLEACEPVSWQIGGEDGWWSRGFGEVSDLSDVLGPWEYVTGFSEHWRAILSKCDGVSPPNDTEQSRPIMP